MGVMLPLSEINGSRPPSRRREVIEVRGFADFPEHQCNTYLASDWRKFYARAQIPPIATPIGSAPADRRHLPEVRKCSWFGLAVWSTFCGDCDDWVGPLHSNWHAASVFAAQCQWHHGKLSKHA
jgi:hypothetical protein